MTETENKYFAVSVDQRDKISFHKNEEEAKKACLNGAEELYDHATHNDDISIYTEQVHNAVYGLVLGKAESKERELTEEEKQSGWYDEIDYIVEHPKIVEYQKCDGWISVKDRLPEIGQQVIAIIDGVAQITIYDCEEWFAYNFEWVDGAEFNGTHANIEQVTHWRPLPPPPTE